jgi:hypothetical protein
MNNNNFFASSLLLVLGLAACGDNVDSIRPDARRTTDAPPTIDGPPGQIDAAIDAVASTVMVTPGLCATPDHTIDNAGQNFQVDGVNVDNPPMVFAVGDDVSVDLALAHNYASAAGTPAQFAFRSGNLGVQACLTFTAEIPLTAGVNYICEAHAATMTNTLVVTP